MSALDRPAAVVLSCRDLAAAEAFFVDLGFRLDTVFPADAPRRLELSGFGLVLCLERTSADGGGHLRLPGDTDHVRIAPNGARIEVTAERVAGPPPSAAFAVHRQPREGGFHLGRAGMLYRDLVPDRLGGACIASWIRIEHGGPVPDYVHGHRIAAQALYCTSGDVRVVYEDQGPPFVMRTGDCVLQPPGIRHRVIDCSDNFEVIEVASPAEHVTTVEHELALPNATVRRDRRFAGQLFHHHDSRATRGAGRYEGGFQMRDCGIGDASGSAIGMRSFAVHDTAAVGLHLLAAPRLRLVTVVRGRVTLHGEPRHRDALHAGDTCVLPPHRVLALAQPSADLELLEVALGTAAAAQPPVKPAAV